MFVTNSRMPGTIFLVNASHSYIILICVFTMYFIFLTVSTVLSNNVLQFFKSILVQSCRILKNNNPVPTFQKYYCLVRHFGLDNRTQLTFHLYRLSVAALILSQIYNAPFL